MNGEKIKKEERKVMYRKREFFKNFLLFLKVQNKIRKLESKLHDRAVPTNIEQVTEPKKLTKYC